MEENVALDSEKQKKFIKSIRGIKKLIKKNEGKAEVQKKEEKEEPQKPFSMRLKEGKVIKKKKRKSRGLVYLSHIPHGFYEHQMVQYFKQFGVVTNVRVIRSKKTGNSKGFAFVEFKEPAVGEIVAETMNNYLMGKRLIKAAYIPPAKQRRAFRKHWNAQNNPGNVLRLKIKKNFNADKDEAGELKRATKLLANLTKTKKKLSELGINYDFFTPVDIPEALLDKIVKQEKDDDTIKKETKPKQEKKEQAKDKKGAKQEKIQNGPDQAAKEVENKKNKNKKNQAEKKEQVNATKKAKVVEKVNEKQQKEKEKKLKDAGVKPPEFIKVGEDSDDSDDSSYAFDSDEYEKVLDHEDGSDLSGSGSDDELEDESGDEEDHDEEGDSNDESEDEEIVPPKKAKGKPAPKVTLPVPGKNKKQGQNKQSQQQQPPKQPKKQEPAKPKPTMELKRKAPQKSANAAKKFEKQSQKPMKKQFKKK